MARWEDVRSSMRKAFQLDRDDPDEFALTIPRSSGSAAGPRSAPGAEAPVTGGREQRVMVRRYEVDSREMIEFRSAFGELGDSDPEALLRETLQLPLGAIALHGRFLVVLHREALGPLSLEGIVYLLTKISLVADELEERRGSDRF